MNRNLISTLIRQRLLNEQYYLTEDRLPALVKKYSGTKEIISEMPHPMSIAMGYKPKTKKIPILSTQHDLLADRVNETNIKSLGIKLQSDLQFKPPARVHASVSRNYDLGLEALRQHRSMKELSKRI